MSETKRLPLIPKTLPCVPCPHKSSCCSWGTMLLGDEADLVRKHHGADTVVWDEEEQELRTRVVDGKCVFLGEKGCSIHEKPYYPSVCRGFPWRFADTEEPYGYDLDICPELENEPA